jgi:putative spermidine/putrescine transport system permease protein
MSSWRIGGILLRAVAALGFALMLLPIVFVSWLSFFKNELLAFPPEAYSLRWFSQIWSQSQFAQGFTTSFEVAAVAMLGGLVLGIPASLALAHHVFRGREAAMALLTAPLIVPSIVIGTALYLFFIEIEIATGWPLAGSLLALALAHILITIPWTVRLITASLLSLDPALEEAAMSLGANRWRTLLRVTLPVIRPAVVAAGLFGFVVSFGNLEISLFLVAPGVTTLPIAILQYLEWKIDPTIAAVSALQIAVIGTGLLVTDRFVSLAKVV